METKPNKPTLSLIVPIHNEAPVLPQFFTQLSAVLADYEGDFEIICINDGSRDDSLQQLLVQQTQLPQLKIINLTRNFGKEAALTAGLAHCKGDAAVPIDADLQDPPELILEFVKHWQQGAQQVVAVRQSRQTDTKTKRATAHWFYRIFNFASDHKIPNNAGDYRLIDRKVIDALLKLPEKDRFMKGLFSWVGFKTEFVYFNRAPRAGGKTSWNYRKLLRFAADGIISFSSLPLRIWSVIGFFIALFSGAYAIEILIKTLVEGRDVPGYASIMVTVLFIGGIQLLSLGIIGEYIAKIYNESKNRPLYIVDEIYD